MVSCRRRCIESRGINGRRKLKVNSLPDNTSESIWRISEYDNATYYGASFSLSSDRKQLPQYFTITWVVKVKWDWEEFMTSFFSSSSQSKRQVKGKNWTQHFHFPHGTLYITFAFYTLHAIFWAFPFGIYATWDGWVFVHWK